jgi:hypothetical protein
LMIDYITRGESPLANSRLNGGGGISGLRRERRGHVLGICDDEVRS